MQKIIPFARLDETLYLEKAKAKILSTKDPAELAKLLDELNVYVGGLNSLGEHGAKLIDLLSPHIRSVMGPYGKTDIGLCSAAVSLFGTAYEKSVDKRRTMQISVEAWKERLEHRM
jgi:hypothetical protein